jgi:glycosyltransferase involved in cell wall biosynthesis
MQTSIVHVMGWVSQQRGSFERFLERLSARCETEGAKTHLVFPSRPASDAFVQNVRADIHIVPLARHPLDRTAINGLRDVLQRTGATHVHAHFGLDAMIAMQVAKRAGIGRRFLTKHILPGNSKLTLAGPRHRWLARQAEVFFAVSDRVADALLAHGIPREKVVRVYLGVDTEAYRPDPARRAAARAMLGLGDERVVLCTSHLREGKGVELLPGLAAGLAADPGNVVVLHAGGGALRESIEAAAAAIPNHPLRLLGVRQDIPELLAAADVFVFPTTGNEGLPLGPVEAMAAGLPIVATTVSDLPRITGDAMHLIPPSDAEALLAACRMLLRDRAAATALGERARTAARERFSVDAAVEAHVARYFGPVHRQE